MIVYRPTMANMKTMTRVMKHLMQLPGDSQAYGKYISRSALSRNRKRNDGLLSCLSSSSLSVGIVILIRSYRTPL